MSEIFDIGHESDLSEYDSTVTDSGDLSQGTPGLASTSGRMECLIDDSTAIYGVKDFTQISSGTYRFRFYIDPNGLTMGAGEQFQVCTIYGPSSQWRCVVNLRDDSPYVVNMWVIDDTTTHYGTSYALSDAEHYIEVLVQYADDADAENGYATMWIDGVEQGSISSLDLSTKSQPDEARLGAIAGIDAGTSGTIYLDELVFRDDATEIGAVSAAEEEVTGYMTPMRGWWGP